VSRSITQQLIKKQTDTPNVAHENLRKVSAAFQTRCKQYFSVQVSLKLSKHTKNCTDFKKFNKNYRDAGFFLGMDGNLTNRDTIFGRRAVRSRAYSDSRSVRGNRSHIDADSRRCFPSIRRLLIYNHTVTVNVERTHARTESS